MVLVSVLLLASVVLRRRVEPVPVERVIKVAPDPRAPSCGRCPVTPGGQGLKVDAQVMLLKNIDVKAKLINGSRGRVVAIQQKDGVIDSIKCDFARAGEWKVKRDDATTVARTVRT